MKRKADFVLFLFVYYTWDMPKFMRDLNNDTQKIKFIDIFREN